MFKNIKIILYLIKEGKIHGKNITVFEELSLNGCCMDGIGSPEKGYVIRGGRMIDKEAYTCMHDLLFLHLLTKKRVFTKKSLNLTKKSKQIQAPPCRQIS